MDNNFVKVETTLNKIKADIKKKTEKMNGRIDCRWEELIEDQETMNAMWKRIEDWEDQSSQLEGMVQRQEAQIDSLVMELDRVRGLACHCNETKVFPWRHPS